VPCCLTRRLSTSGTYITLLVHKLGKSRKKRKKKEKNGQKPVKNPQQKKLQKNRTKPSQKHLEVPKPGNYRTYLGQPT
jgi:hypothetical protein